MNWVFIIVIIIFLACAIHGGVKGFLRLVFSLLSFFVFIWLIRIVTPYISNFLTNNTGIYALIEERCQLTMQQRLGVGLEFIAAPVAGAAAEWVLKGASFLIAFVAAQLIVRIVSHALGLVNRIPVIGGTNRFFGVLAGVAEGYVIVSLLFLFISVIAGTAFGSGAAECISGNPFLSFLYYNNAILKMCLK